MTTLAVSLVSSVSPLLTRRGVNRGQSCMKKIKLSQGKYALVDDTDYEFLSQYKWSVSKTRKTFYAIKSLVINKKTNKRQTLIMHRMIMNTPKDMHTDHINGNGLDNRRKNLRICTSMQNSWNSRTAKNNKSGYKGVCFIKYRNKYKAQICHNRKIVFLGYFTQKADAAIAYNNASKIFHGAFSNLNVIK